VYIFLFLSIIFTESKVNRKKRKLDEDEYSSDEDSFLDRTGAAEKKRLSKLKGKASNSIETFDSLVRRFCISCLSYYILGTLNASIILRAYNKVRVYLILYSYF